MSRRQTPPPSEQPARSRRPASPGHDTLTQARAAVLAGDRGQALAILKAIATATGAPGADIPSTLAEALVATAREAARREETDRRALERYERAQAARGEILRLIREAPLDRDDLARIGAALREKECEIKAEERQRVDEDRAAGQAAGVAVRRMGAGYLEVKWIPKPNGRVNGPYLYYRLKVGPHLRSVYIGKASSGRAA